MLGTYHTESLLNALSDLHHIHEKNYLYTFVLNRCCDVLKAQGGTYFSVKPELGELIPEASKGVAITLLKEIPFKTKSGLSGWTATNRKSLLVENAQADDRFNRAVDVITGIRTRSVLCVPIIRQDKMLGILELVNKVDGVFRDPDLKFAEYLSGQVGIAIENCSLFNEVNGLLAYTSSVINSLTGGFISTDTHGTVTRCNTAACRILNVTNDEVVGKALNKCLPHYPAFSAILDVTQKHETPVLRQEIELQKPDGSSLSIGYSTFLIRDDSQVVLGAGIIFQDLTLLKRS